MSKPNKNRFDFTTELDLPKFASIHVDTAGNFEIGFYDGHYNTLTFDEAYLFASNMKRIIEQYIKSEDVDDEQI